MERLDRIFRYTAINLKGEKVKGEYYDNNIKKLNLMLREKGYFLLNLNIKRRSFRDLFSRKVGLKDLSTLCSGLSTMISSGIPIFEALNIMEDLSNKKQIKKSLNEIKKGVNRGQTIHKSMKEFSDVYPLFMSEMIRVGEESGRIDEVLKKLSEYYEECDKMFAKIKTAITYPLLVFISSIFIIIFLMTKIIPQFTEILRSNGGEIPFATRMILFFYTFLKTNFITINIILFLITFIIYSYSKTLVGKAYLDRLKTRIPLFNKFYDKLIMSKFATSMGILISSGFTILKALEIAQSLLENKVAETKIINSIEDIKKGQSIYYSFKKQNLGSNLFLSLVKTGEESGKLDNMLLRAGQIFQNDVSENLKKIVTFIEPITILFLAFFIGTFVIAAFMPVFNIMDSI